MNDEISTSNLDNLHRIDIGPGTESGIEDVVIAETYSFFSFFRQIYGFYAIFAILIFIASLIPEPLLEQSHVRPMWSLARPGGNSIIATQIHGLLPLNHKVRLSIRFLDVNTTKPPQIGGPIQIIMIKNHKIIADVKSSYLPQIADKIELIDSKSPYHCVFESNVVNYDTLYFKAIVHGNYKPEQSVEVKWNVIRIFFASFEGTFSFTFGIIIFLVILFRFVQQPELHFYFWFTEQKATFWLSITVLSFDFLAVIPSFFFPSLYSLAIGEIVRSILRSYLIFYSLIIYNLMLREQKRLRTFRSFLPLIFTVTYFATLTVYLVSNVQEEVEFLWPIETRNVHSPTLYFLLGLSIIFVIWIIGLIVTTIYVLEYAERTKAFIFSMVSIPFLAIFLLCEIFIHDLKWINESAVTYSISNGAINTLCLLVEFLHWPISD
ncbi:hypothetical protein TRFO_35423 [Tritrichomonas foetus]|uniref:Wntless-like transmembrane domain-containing protein n=1 Tax=Tritrichomonas foetus TaxID=1144522 RepID=A0A1J4JIQ3_9EUKA|nr:hypothetical protein TRFO_35423 [Tritrichomonas foetus]|eukprot:OHS98223.1 hypothetical protein TRFO_35423 [Tritrichomonas foetus]